MSHLVTITSKFYDKSGHRLINLNVKSRYQAQQEITFKKQMKVDYSYFKPLRIEQ